MRGRKKNPIQTAATQRIILEKSYELYTRKNIESVSMIEVAKECGLGTTTLYRYYSTKPELVLAVATWIWDKTIRDNEKRRPSRDFEGMTAEEIFNFYLESFVELYRMKRDLLRFNQFLNIYIQSENIDPKVMKPYQDIIEGLKVGFHEMYTRAEQDHTIRTDESEEEMFSTTLHLMLAAVTRYAVGLVYIPESGFDAEKELEKQKEALLMRYKAL
ncbi:MAG: TetR/AcrR family transcriptional regulator [Lachnospiraceae bacterium]|nr:TetR/AcrR family transcriptional regulator [Lachnospiraceae bacterium]